MEVWGAGWSIRGTSCSRERRGEGSSKRPTSIRGSRVITCRRAHGWGARARLPRLARPGVGALAALATNSSSFPTCSPFSFFPRHFPPLRDTCLPAPAAAAVRSQNPFGLFHAPSSHIHIQRPGPETTRRLLASGENTAFTLLCARLCFTHYHLLRRAPSSAALALSAFNRAPLAASLALPSRSSISCPLYCCLQPAGRLIAALVFSLIHLPQLYLFLMLACGKAHCDFSSEAVFLA